MEKEAFEDLVLKYLDGLAGPAEVADLNRLLRSRPDLADLFVKISGTESLISAAHVAPPEGVPLLSDEPSKPVAVPAALPVRPARPRPAPRRSWEPFLVAAGALAGVGLVFLLWPSAPTPAPRIASARPPKPPPPEEEAVRRAEVEMERIGEESRKTQERLTEVRKEPAVEPEKKEEERKRREAELADLEMKRKEAEEALEKARREAEEARKREAERTVAAAATLDEVEGQVQAGGAPARAGQPLLAGQALETAGAKSRAVLAFADGSRAELGPDTVVREIQERGRRFFVARGSVLLEAAKRQADRPLLLATPHGEVRVLGTTLRVTVDRATRLEVREGRARITRSDGKSVEVPPDHFAVAAPGVDLVARPIPVRIEEAFAKMPAGSSTFDAAWGGPAAWSIGPGGFLQGARAAQGSSAMVLVYAVPASSILDLSVSMRCPRFTGGYWMEAGYRLGAHTAEDFDSASAQWTLVKKFDSFGGQNGNNNQWTRYSAQVRTGTFTQVTVGFKLGAQGGAGPAVGWDALRLSH